LEYAQLAGAFSLRIQLAEAGSRIGSDIRARKADRKEKNAPPHVGCYER
jgi:hypothetical protein